MATSIGVPFWVCGSFRFVNGSKRATFSLSALPLFRVEVGGADNKDLPLTAAGITVEALLDARPS